MRVSATASLGIELSDGEIRTPEALYTPRYDFQGISDDADLQAVMARLPQFTTAHQRRGRSRLPVRV